MILEFKLATGIPLEGEDNLIDVVLKEPTAGDILDARAASEIVRMVPGGVAVVVESQAKYDHEIALRMVVSIGGKPCVAQWLLALSGEDHFILQGYVDDVYNAIIKKVRDKVSREGESET